MRYFVANLSCHVGLLFLVILFVVIFLTRNQKKKTKHVFTYFFPVILAIVALYQIFVFIIPRAQDIVNVYENNYYSYTGKVESISRFKNYVVIDGEAYYCNPIHVSVEEGDDVRVRYTTNSRYAVDISEIETDINSEDSGSTGNSPFVNKD